MDAKGTRARRRSSARSTVGVLLLLTLPLAAAAVTARRLQQGDSGPVATLAFLGAAVAGVLQLGLLLRVVAGPRRLKRRRWLPYAAENEVRSLLDLSMFGSGSMLRWTTHNPDVSLAAVRPAVSLDQLRATGIEAGDPPPRPVPDDERRGHSQVTEEPRLPPSTVFEPHVVQRGETFWTLAAASLGEGTRWRELRSANVDLEVAPGVRLRLGDILQPGWRIRLPVVELDDEERG